MNVAILIDAENVLPAHAELIFSHASSLGEIAHKEIYGAAQALSAWVAPVLKYAIHPNLTIKASKGKNSSDIALVIGAMDLLVSGGVDAAVIASSDSDFSALSVRLRNAGIQVVGMGTEKANELWRTACSSFVVLQQPGKAAAKPAAKPAQAPAPAKPAQPAEPKPRRAARAAASTHEQRAAVLRDFIMKQLESRGGRIQTGVLFPMLNKLHEYQVDKKGSGKKPLNYLTATFGEVFRFEDSADGNSWVSLASAPAIAAEEAAPAEAALAGAQQEAASEAQREVPAARQEAPEAQPADEVEAPEAPAGAAEASEEAPAGADPLALLLEAGLPEDVARQIVVIFTESNSLRAAYNRLRSTFGSTAGREYYQTVKEIAGRQ